MQSIRAHAICCLVLSVVCAGCSAVHKVGPSGKVPGGVESATVSGPTCVVIRRGTKVATQFLEAGQTKTFGGSNDSISQVGVFPLGDRENCGVYDYDLKAGTLCMKCAGQEDSEYAAKMGIACCV